MTRSTSLTRRIAGAVAPALAASLLLAVPAAAEGPNPETTAATDDATACEPGALGDGGAFEVRQRGDAAADGIVRVEIAHQCERMLDDGTYIPGGYRVRLYETCDGGECPLPFVFATEGGNETYGGRVEIDGEPTQIRFRANQRGVLTMTAVSGAGRGADRERERYVLRPAR